LRTCFRHLGAWPRRILLALPLALPLALAACASGPSDPSAPPADTDKALAEAAVALNAGDPDTALQLLDQTRRSSPDLTGEALGRIDLLAGEANLVLARQTIDKGGSGTLIEGCLLDAETCLMRAATALPESADPRQLLAEVHLERGQSEAAVQSATEALERLGFTGQVDPSKPATKAIFEPLLQRARARVQLIAAARQQAGDTAPDEATLALAEEAIKDLAVAQQVERRRPEPYQQAAIVFRWVGKNTEGMRVLEDGLRADPSHAPHHTALQDLYVDQGRQTELVGLYGRLERAIRPTSADVVWFHARAVYLCANADRAKGNRKAADGRYDQAIEIYARCGELNANYKENCDIMRALCAVSRARMALDEGDEKVAEEQIDRAFAFTPRIAEIGERGADRWFDGFEKSYRGGIYALGGRLMSGGGQSGRLREARAFFRKIATRHPTWGEAWSNLGFACRDLGAMVEREDKTEAMKLFEESFAAYKQAIVHSPDDARIQNDCGLMLVYHLHREPEFAVKQFEKAIAIGTAKLDDLPAKSADEDAAMRTQRDDLEEAVGDAWQNWGVLLEQQGKKAEAVERYRKALAFYPYDRREAARKLKELEAAPTSPDKTPAPARSDAKSGDDAGGKQAGAGFATPLLLAGLVAVLAPAVPADDVPEGLAKLLAGDAEGALEIADKLLRSRQDDAEVWFLAGSASLAFAKQQMQAGGKGVEANLIDAIERLRKADELTRSIDAGSKNLGPRIHVEPAIALIDALVQHGEADAAVSLGRRHLTHLDSLGLKLDAAVVLRLRIAAADASVRQAIAKVEAGGDAKADIEAARSQVTLAVSELEKNASPLDLTKLASTAHGPVEAVKLFQAWANLEEWAKRPVAALRACARGAQLLSGEPGLACVNHMLGVVQRAQRDAAEPAIETIDGLLARRPGDAALLWYRGYARVLHGDELRRKSDNPAAAHAYAEARRDLEASAKANAAFAESAGFWIAMSLTSEGWCAHVDKQVDKAKDLWLQACRKSADTADKPDGLGQSAKVGLLTLGGEHFRRNAFAEGAALMEESLAALGKDDVDLLNNLALFLREHGTRNQGAEGTAAEKTFEKSWAAYKRAVALDPDNARLLNDTALIDVYYLKKNRAEAEQMLRRAIEVGGDKLANEPPEGDQAKRDLEEAVGDARMNLGLMLIDEPQKWDEAESELKKSLDYWPKAQRASNAHLRTLARKRRDAGKKDGQEARPVKDPGVWR
jgi:tetratricopeptide (TPR) repeat protein